MQMIIVIIGSIVIGTGSVALGATINTWQYWAITAPITVLFGFLVANFF